MFRSLQLRLANASRAISSSQVPLGRGYFGSRPPLWSSSCSCRRQGSSASASLKARGLLASCGMRSLFAAYEKAQARRPYATQIGTSIVIWLCGDLSAQLLFPPEPVKHGSSSERLEAQRYDPWRMARHLTIGIVASVPSYKWFLFLHGQFNFASRAASLATKVLVQQAIYTPIFNTYFFAAQSLLSGASVDDTLLRLQLALPTSIVAGWKVWSGVALVSFMYVPAQFRSVFSGCVAVAWQSYLSLANRTAERKIFNTKGYGSGVY